MKRLALLAILAASPAIGADLEFCWEGANGYAFVGYMTIPESSLSQPIVTEADVQSFAISGSLNGMPLGVWTLDKRTADTSWNLNFDPQSMTFLTGGFSPSPNGQQWNANGGVADCGKPGFGFNSGAGGQDVCVDGARRADSTIAADSPFVVYQAGAGPACSAVLLLGSLLYQQNAAS